jgi:SET domain-containing protein
VKDKEKEYYLNTFGFFFTNQVIKNPHHKLLPIFKEESSRSVEIRQNSLFVKFVSKAVGFGLFTHEKIAPGTLLGVYSGLYRPIAWMYPTLNPYCLLMPTHMLKSIKEHQPNKNKRYVIDALRYGNLFRFMNHSEAPNLGVKWVGITPKIYSISPIAAEAELLISYGVGMESPHFLL